MLWLQYFFFISYNSVEAHWNRKLFYFWVNHRLRLVIFKGFLLSDREKYGGYSSKTMYDLKVSVEVVRHCDPQRTQKSNSWHFEWRSSIISLILTVSDEVGPRCFVLALTVWCENHYLKAETIRFWSPKYFWMVQSSLFNINNRSYRGSSTDSTCRWQYKTPGEEGPITLHSTQRPHKTQNFADASLTPTKT